MKKLLSFNNLALLSIIFLMSCNKTDITHTTASSQASIKRNASAKGPCEGYGCKICTDHSGTSFAGIDAKLAKSLFNNYRKLNQPRLKLANGEQDANRLWFSLESLKNFIWKIEQEICNRPCATENELKLGIRIYYGKYPQNIHIDGLNILPKDFAERHTLFMVPTYEDAKGVQIDFDPWNWGEELCKPTSLADLFNQELFKNQSCFFSIVENQYYKDKCGDIQAWRSGPLNAIMNHGDINPPPHDETKGSGFITND